MPPAFVLSQDQTLQTKFLQYHDQLAASISFFKIQSCRKSFRFAIFLLRLLNPFQDLKIISRVHRTIQFSKITCSLQSSSLFQAQWKCNLACFFNLSNRFLNFFQIFFSTASLQPPGSSEAWGWNIARFLHLSNRILKIFRFFSRAPPGPLPSFPSAMGL